MTMKKNLVLLSAIITFTAFILSCSSDLTDERAAQEKAVILNAGTDNDTNSRVSYTEDGSKITAAWQNTDAIKVYTATDLTNSSDVNTVFNWGSTTDAHHAIFTGAFTSLPTVGDLLYAYVKQDNAGIYVIKASNRYAVAAIASQDGTLAGAESRNLLATTATYQDNMSCVFSYKMAILKLRLTLPASVGSNVDAEVALNATSGLYKSVAFNSTDFTVANNSLGKLVVNTTFIGGTEKDVYFCIAPSAIKSLGVEVTVGNNVYNYIIGDKTVEAGRFYMKTVDMSSVIPTNYIFIQNFGRFTYGGDDANMLPGLNPTTEGTAPNLTLTSTISTCGYSVDVSDAFLQMGSDYRTSRGISTTDGWDGSKVYEHPGFVKIGVTKEQGWLQIPAFATLTTTKDVVLSFDAMAYDANITGTTSMTVSTVVGTTPTVVKTIDLPARTTQTAGEWQHYSVDISGANSSMFVKITGGSVTGLYRVLLDNIRVIEK